MTVSIRMDASNLIKALDNVVNNLPKELGVVAKKTAKRGQSFVAKSVASELAIPQKDIKKAVSISFPDTTSAIIRLRKERRFSLKRFKPRQTKKGVSYKISKTRGRKKIQSAFISQKLGGHVFKRKGKTRFPINKLKGPSPWGVMRVDSRISTVQGQIRTELRKQLADRVRYQTLKKSGGDIMPLLKRVRVLAAKHETTLGTAIAVDATDATFNAYAVEIQSNLEFNERMQQGSFSMLAGTIGKRPGTLSFKTGLSGNGAAASPGWLDTLLPAVGMIEATDTFSPNTAGPATTAGTGVNHTVTIAVYENGVKKFLAGAMGNLKVNCTVGQPVELEWTFTGIWQPPVDATILAPTYDTVSPLVFRAATMTIAGSAPGCVNTLSIDLGNVVTMRECANNTSGLAYAVITDRKVTGTWDPESQLVATEDVFGLWLAGTEEAFSLALTDGTDTVTIAAPQAQRTNIQEGERNGIQVDNITWMANSASAGGDDELTIDFSLGKQWHTIKQF